LGPIGIRVHLTGDQEMGMEATGYGRRVWNRGPLRHMLGRFVLVLVWEKRKEWEGEFIVLASHVGACV